MLPLRFYVTSLSLPLLHYTFPQILLPRPLSFHIAVCMFSTFAHSSSSSHESFIPSTFNYRIDSFSNLTVLPHYLTTSRYVSRFVNFCSLLISSFSSHSRFFSVIQVTSWTVAHVRTHILHAMVTGSHLVGFLPKSSLLAHI